eukprot:SAG11_NODE_6673_length_1270_cov_0.941076_2_plen_82_part_00
MRLPTRVCLAGTPSSTLVARCVRRLDAGKRGEGLNLADFGADQYGPSFTVETGLFLPFASRVRTAKLVAQTLLDVFAARYA